MSEIILPYDPDPFIKTYPYLSFYLGILSGNQIEIRNLLINEFMHIFSFAEGLILLRAVILKESVFAINT